MDLARFAELADAYGGDLGRWPEEERTAAAALMRQDPGAVAALGKAAALDAALAALPTDRPNDALVARVLGDAARVSAELGRHPRPGEQASKRRLSGRSAWSPGGSGRWSVGVVGLAAAAGLAVGFFTPAPIHVSPKEAASTAMIALFANDADADEVAPL